MVRHVEDVVQTALELAHVVSVLGRATRAGYAVVVLEGHAVDLLARRCGDGGRGRRVTPPHPALWGRGSGSEGYSSSPGAVGTGGGGGRLLLARRCGVGGGRLLLYYNIHNI